MVFAAWAPRWATNTAGLVRPLVRGKPKL
jgi:hypothetical protein